MKKSICLLLVATAVLLQSAQAQLYDNSNIRTGTGNGFNGADTSAIGATNVSFGFGDNSTGTNTIQLADRFVLGSASTISSISFDGYSTSAYPFPPTSPFTSATLSIWNGQPGAGGAVLFTSTTLSMTAWTGIYRVTSTTLTNAQRPVMTLSMLFPNVALAAGTYWASWAVTGVVAPGNPGSVFDPPVMNADGTTQTGVAIQSLNGGTTWAALADSGQTISLPITVNGSVVPEPASAILTLIGGLGGLVMLRGFRRKSA